MVQKTMTRWISAILMITTMTACNPSDDAEKYSRFGPYQPLPQWSDWCIIAPDPSQCAATLRQAVEQPTASSRSTVRAHGWKLWAAINTPIDKSGYDSTSGTSNQFGTSGCWHESSAGKPACDGVFPLWLTWPNTGVPFQAEAKQPDVVGDLIAINNNFVNASLVLDTNSAVDEVTDVVQAAAYPDPTKIHTVNTVPTATNKMPSYPLPPLTVQKQCGLSADMAKKLVDTANTATGDARKLAWQALQAACAANGKPNVVCAMQEGICDGSAFVNQGDVMIATESMTSQAWSSIQQHQLYGGTDTLANLYKQGDPKTAATQVADWLDPAFITTKHMYWPVKGCKPGVTIGDPGCRVRYGALPPWVPAFFKDKNYATNADYSGYERWDKVVAIDTCGRDCPATKNATLQLAGVANATAISTNDPDVYAVDTFVHLQVSEETLNTGFTATDRALLDQATIWAYGADANGFEAGDYLVVAAMHIITREIDSTTFQSVWWSPMNDTLADCPVADYANCFGQSPAYGAESSYSGLDPATIKSIDERVGTAWRDYYVMTDSYGIPYEIDGTPTDVRKYFPSTPPVWATQRSSGEKMAMLPVSMNVYIEPVIHPLGTNCQNCHRRAGALSKSPGDGEYASGVGRANYQNAQCPSLLGDYGLPANDPCMMTPWAWNQSATWDGPVDNTCTENANGGTECHGKEAFPIVNTALSFIIADGHIQGGPPASE